MLDGHYSYVDNTKDFEIGTATVMSPYDYFKQKNMVNRLHHERTTQVPIYEKRQDHELSKKTPSVPTQEETDEHNLNSFTILRLV
eukprot:944034-Amphidinium_carterae.2